MKNLRTVLVTGLVSLLTACGGGSDCNLLGGAVCDSSTAAANLAPVARAGSNQSVLLSGPAVQLDGSTSSDANNDPITYQWTLLTKPTASAVVLSGTAAASLTFTPDVVGGYVFSLVVSDGKLSSAPSLVTVTASVLNVAPVAVAGANLSVLLNGLAVQLDGSSSSDSNGDGITYQWTLLNRPAGSAVVLNSATAVRPSLTPDVAGSYVFSLVVSDGRLTSSPSIVTVMASQVNAPPVANAGPDQSVLVNAVVTLDGRDSSDANPADQLTYSWNLNKPDGTSQTLTGVRPTFTAAVTGVYTAALTVSDGLALSATDQVRIQVSPVNAPPVAVITGSTSVTVGGLVSVSGLSSTDGNGDVLTYKWSLLSKPMLASGATANSVAVLSSTTLVNPTFTADVAGVYVVGLVVNDGKVNSDTVTVAVTASALNLPPVANAGPEQVVAVAAVVTLNGSGSTDANGDTLSYQWTLTTRPNTSVAALVSPTTARPTFTADVAGFYVATLTVSDCKGGSHVSRVLIKAE
jgi:hypothetical protein